MVQFCLFLIHRDCYNIYSTNFLVHYNIYSTNFLVDYLRLFLTSVNVEFDQKFGMGVPFMAQWKQIQLGTMRLWV